MREKHTRQPWWLRRKPVLIALPVLLILGLALGLGLGLTIGRDDDDGDSEEEAPAPSPTQRTRWKPAVNDTWQIVLLNPIELEPDATSVTPDVAVFDIDLFDTPKETIDTLHRLGKKVICYFSGGSFEPGRPDSEEFDSEDLGAELDGWPGERWLKLGSDGVREIMRKRVELAHEKGCDGIDPDNVDGYVSTYPAVKIGEAIAPFVPLVAYLAKATGNMTLLIVRIKLTRLSAKRKRTRLDRRRFNLLPFVPLGSCGPTKFVTRTEECWGHY
jgi:hypothetical protein